jgi:Kinesin motor domain
VCVEQRRGVPGQPGGERILRSKFNLVDLAGSEKWDIRQEMGDERVNELTSINVSLYTLGR